MSPWIVPAGDDGTIRCPGDTGRAPVVAHDDIAEPATRVLTDTDPHADASHDLESSTL
ncbi:hypothetical protein [Streptomyces sp. NBC_01615]|uniref:hypothetical protein n=1 Tax=Streptomyces sp. NBC_01615 TaxID=2975898 RepID=UPI00386E0680